MEPSLDRYCQIEELIDERRALARRLGLPAIERECDQRFVKLASAFPEFGRAGNDSGVMVLMDPARASAALTQLQVKFVDALGQFMDVPGAQPPATAPVFDATNAATVVLDHPALPPLDLDVTKKLPR